MKQVLRVNTTKRPRYKLRLALFLLIAIVVGVVLIDAVQRYNIKRNTRVFDSVQASGEWKEYDVSGLTEEEIIELLKILQERKGND